MDAAGFDEAAVMQRAINGCGVSDAATLERYNGARDDGLIA